jgi:hypothetical protein
MRRWICRRLGNRWGSKLTLTVLILSTIWVVAANGIASYRFDGDPPIAKIRGITLLYYRAPEHASPPVNRLDPYDSFRKDEKDDLLITATGTNIFSNCTETEYHGYALQTKKGTPILVYQASPTRRWRYKANCHGYTFLGGDYWLRNAQVKQILEDNGWVIVSAEDAQPGDVAIYRDSTGTIVHSAIVVGKDLKGHVLVDSKSGYDLDRKAVWAARVIP